MEWNHVVGIHYRIRNADDHGDSHGDRQGIEMNPPLEVIQLLEILFVGHDGSYANADVETDRQLREHQGLIPEKFRPEGQERAGSSPRAAPAKELYNTCPDPRLIPTLRGAQLTHGVSL